MLVDTALVRALLEALGAGTVISSVVLAGAAALSAHELHVADIRAGAAVALGYDGDHNLYLLYVMIP